MTDYDEVPYEGGAVPLSHPARLAVAAMREGLSPRHPAQASVLELGCAEGRNLLPMAHHLDEARFLGVDGSSAHIRAATEGRDRLGLDNLELRHADFRELESEDLGEHDYVIVHGVLSWVDVEVRDALLRLVRRHLAPDGVAYLSYNCAAGWALGRELRALLLHHTEALDTVEAKVRASRELLALLAASPLREASLHAASLAERAQAALEHRDAYLLHEYLAPQNHPFRHREILELARRHELTFVSELAWATHRGDLEDALRSQLTAQYPDPLDVEEMADVMLGRPFRASMFCRADATRGSSEADALARLGVVRGAIAPEAKRPSLDPGVSETFLAASGAKIGVRHPVLKAALLELFRAWPGQLSIPELHERAALLLELRRVTGIDARADETLRAVAQDLIELARLEHLELAVLNLPYAVEEPPLPRVAALTRYEAERGPAVTTPHHAVVALDPFLRLLVQHLDGSRDRAELTGRMAEHVDAEDVVLSDESGQPLEGEARSRAIADLIARGIETLRINALLTA